MSPAVIDLDPAIMDKLGSGRCDLGPNGVVARLGGEAVRTFKLISQRKAQLGTNAWLLQRVATKELFGTSRLVKALVRACIDLEVMEGKNVLQFCAK